MFGWNLVHNKYNVVAIEAQEYLESHGIANCTVVLPVNYHVKYEVEDCTVMEEEIAIAIENETESYNELIEYDANKAIEKNDFVQVTNSGYNISRNVYYKKNGKTVTLCNTCETVGGCVGGTFYKAGTTTGLTKGKVLEEGASYTMTADECFDGKEQKISYRSSIVYIGYR